MSGKKTRESGEGNYNYTRNKRGKERRHPLKWIHKKIKPYYSILIILLAILVFGSMGGIFALLAIVIIFSVRLYRRRDLWWHPFKDQVDFTFYGMKFKDMTKKQRKEWREKEKVLTWNGKKLFKISGRKPK